MNVLQLSCFGLQTSNIVVQRSGLSLRLAMSAVLKEGRVSPEALQLRLSSEIRTRL